MGNLSNTPLDGVHNDGRVLPLVVGQHRQHVDHGLTVLVQVRQTGHVLLPDRIV